MGVIQYLFNWVVGKPKETLRCPRCHNRLNYRLNNKKSTLFKNVYLLECPVCNWTNKQRKDKSRSRKSKKKRRKSRKS